MKKGIAVFLALLFVFALAGCGAEAQPGKAATEKATTRRVMPAPSAAVDPLEIDFGYCGYGVTDNPAAPCDCWYAFDKKGDAPDCIWFRQPLTLCRNDGECAFKTNNELHCIPAGKNPTFDFDIVFIDPFTCYDSVTGTYFVRGELTFEETEDLLSGTKYAFTDEYSVSEDKTERDTYSLEFREDGTCTLTENDFEYEGSWELKAPRVIRTEFETFGENYYIEYNGDGSVAYIGDSANMTANHFEKIQ